MSISFRFLPLCVAACFCASAWAASDAPLKIGVITSLSGQFAEDGVQKKEGIELYLKQHDNKLGGREVTLVYKDNGGLNPSLVKRQATELIQEKVDILADLTITGNLRAAAPVSTQTKTPIISMIPDFPSTIERSPYVLYTSEDLSQSPLAMAHWAYDNGHKNVFVLVSDYSGGHEVEAQFKGEFERLGGHIADAVRVPLNATDYSPYLQRAKEAGVNALFVMVPNGQPAISLFKGIEDRKLREAGIKILATGGVTGERALSAIGDPALGTITAFNYSEAHDSDVNRKFVAEFKAAYPDSRPSYISVAAYDGMHLIDLALQRSGGDSDGDAFIEAAKGLQWESPRGPVRIDPETRNIWQQEYYREVKRVDGVLQNVEFGDPRAPQ